MARNDEHDRDREWRDRDETRQWQNQGARTSDRQDDERQQRDVSGGGMGSGWQGGPDRDRGYGGGMGSYGEGERETHWGARDQYGQGSEGWNRQGESWGGRNREYERDQNQGGRGGWEGRDRGDEWREPNRQRGEDAYRGSEQKWGGHMANWGEGAGTEQYRGGQRGWGGDAYNREGGSERHRCGAGRGYTPGYGGMPERRGGRGGEWGGDRQSYNNRDWSRGWDREALGNEWDQGTSMRDRAEPGRHAGRGPRNYQRSDDRIREDIIQRLTDHPDIDASDLDVEVKNGEVTLNGTVDERRARHLAEDLVDRVWGVRDVRNEIRVKRNEPNTGLASGAASFHSGSTSYPTLTAPAGEMPRSGGHQQTTGQQEGSNAGEQNPRSAEHRQNVSAGDQGTRNEQIKNPTR